uniref:Secreted protein n=1 Tax=Electrophorus electricus TaxID=8005 RepID=A0A4W4GJ69_ELEEL
MILLLDVTLSICLNTSLFTRSTSIAATAVSPPRPSLVPAWWGHPGRSSTPEPVVRYGASNLPENHQQQTAPSQNKRKRNTKVFILKMYTRI